METSSLSQVQKTSSIQNSKATHAVRAAEQNDSVTVSQGAKEAQKIARWVEMLKEMPDVPPSHLEKEALGDRTKIVVDRLMEDVGAFLINHP